MAQKQKTEKVELTNACIFKEEDATAIVRTLNELPLKYSNLITPVLQKFQTCYRGNITLDVPVPEKAKK